MKNHRLCHLIPIFFTFCFLLCLYGLPVSAATYSSNIVKKGCEPYYRTNSRVGVSDVTIGDDTYKDSITFNTFNSQAAEAGLNLEGGYTKISFVIGNVYGNADRTVTFEADGEVIYTQVAENGALPKAGSINVTGVKQLVIRVSGTPSSYVTFVGNIQLTSKSGYKKDTSDISSNLLVNCSPYYSYRSSTADIDMGGHHYLNALCFNTFNYQAGEMSFNLGGTYQYMTFVVGNVTSWKENRTLTIEADGVTIYEQEVKYNAVPVAGSVSLSGVHQLTFKVSGSSSSFTTAVAQIHLVSDGVVRGIKLNQESLDLTSLNSSAYLTATVIPDTASNTSVIWSSSDTSVATVSSKGLVKGVSGGDAEITAKAAGGNYSATCTVHVDMPKSISKAKVKLSNKTYTYDGTAHTPDVTVTLDGTELTAGTDYTVSYSKNKSAGTAKVTITGINNYKGTVKTSFKINKASQKITLKKSSYSVVAGSGAFSLGASAKTSITYTSADTSVVSIASKKATPLKAGKITITVTAAASTNYKAATAKIIVTVLPKAPTLYSPISSTTKTMELKWKKVTGITGYEIQYSSSKDFSSAKTVKVGKKVTTTTITKLSKNKVYYVRIRSYSKMASGILYSSYSKTRTVRTQ